jgi:hypothetical protein
MANLFDKLLAKAAAKDLVTATGVITADMPFLRQFEDFDDFIFRGDKVDARKAAAVVVATQSSKAATSTAGRRGLAKRPAIRASRRIRPMTCLIAVQLISLAGRPRKYSPQVAVSIA